MAAGAASALGHAGAAAAALIAKLQSKVVLDSQLYICNNLRRFIFYIF